MVLFAALLLPLVIDWNAYRSAFEHEAEKILGQPVRVVGDAEATLLPMPALTFHDVRVGDTEGRPMMSVERFSVRVELMPLLTGQFQVVDMTLDRPQMRVSVDDRGVVDWLIRSQSTQEFDPDRVALSGVQINDGSVSFTDARNGSSLELTDINTNSVEARSLLGPWRMDGSFKIGGTPASFRVSTGRVQDDGAIRVNTEVTPSDPAGTLRTDGMLRQAEAGLEYQGHYVLTKLGIGEGSGATGARTVTDWTSEGTFTLAPTRLVLDNFGIGIGDEQPPQSLTGTLTVDIGAKPHFSAEVKSRQIDLDTALGNGPANPIDVRVAAAELERRLAGLPAPPFEGTIGVDIPGVVVGGGVIDTVRFSATAAPGGWRLEDLEAELPGHTRVTAGGLVSTGEAVGFDGTFSVACAQPAAFAGWWRGGAGTAVPARLEPFDIAGKIVAGPVNLRLDELTAHLGDATAKGRISWQDKLPPGNARRVTVDLSADRLDADSLADFAAILVGGQLPRPADVADSISLTLAADQLVAGTATMRGVDIDASLSGDAVHVNRFKIADLAGAAIEIERGGVLSGWPERPQGSLVTHLDAATLTGLAELAAHLWPDAPATAWLRRAAPALTPAKLVATVAVAADSGALNVAVNGVAAGTSLALSADIAGGENWRDRMLDLSVTAENADTVALATQVGLDLVPVAGTGSGRIKLTLAGVPATGLETHLAGTYAGLAYGADGTLSLGADGPAFAGSATLSGADAGPALLLAGVGSGALGLVAAPVDIAAKATTDGWSAAFDLDKASVSGQPVTGHLTVTSADAAPTIGGHLDLDTLDLGWLAGLWLGAAPVPTGDPQAPWPDIQFTPPTVAGLSGKLSISARRLIPAEGFDIANAELALSLEPDGLEAILNSGSAAGGAVDGALQIRNPGGEAVVSGRLGLHGAALDALVWRREGQPVAEGSLDLTLQFDASGRTPAGLISALGGSGSFDLRDGRARFVNPEAFAQVIQAMSTSDDMPEDQLRTLFAGYLDAGSLAFTHAGATFEIVAGVVRAKTIFADVDKAEAIGRANIDLNAMTLDSSWDLALGSGSETIQGIDPAVTISFAGPLAAPERRINVVPLVGYLAVRAIAEADRLQAEILERERLSRLLRKFQEDHDRAQAATERAAAEAEAARLAAEAAANAPAQHPVPGNQAAGGLTPVVPDGGLTPLSPGN